MERTNALAELAERLVGIAEVFRHEETTRFDDIIKAQRIVAELAKADATYIADPVHNNICLLAYDALRNCRAIAKEGDGYGKM